MVSLFLRISFINTCTSKNKNSKSSKTFISLITYDSCAQVEQLLVLVISCLKNHRGFLGKLCAFLWVYILYYCFNTKIFQEQTFYDEKLFIDGILPT